MRADVIQRVSNIWSDYQAFLDTEVGGYSIKKMMEEAPDDELKKKTLRMACGGPPYQDRNCALLAWEVREGRWD